MPSDLRLLTLVSTTSYMEVTANKGDHLNTKANIKVNSTLTIDNK